MKTKETVTICPANYMPFTRIRTSFTVNHKIGGAIGSKAHKLRDKSCLNKRLCFSSDAPPYQSFRDGPAGNAEKKMLEKYVRSRNVYENKGSTDKMPVKKSDIFDLDSDIFG